jgi:hypothetical protein
MQYETIRTKQIYFYILLHTVVIYSKFKML